MKNGRRSTPDKLLSYKIHSWRCSGSHNGMIKGMASVRFFFTQMVLLGNIYHTKKHSCRKMNEE